MLTYKASAPCSFMLLGEYSVLLPLPYGEAIVIAVESRITIELRVTPNQKLVYIYSPLGDEVFNISQLSIQLSCATNRFAAAVLEHFQSLLYTGCVIHITSSCDPTIGMGTSAAFTVALVSVLQQWLQPHLFTQHQILIIARKTIRIAQNGLGSGADVAASIWGGVIHYNQHTNCVTELRCDQSFFAGYVGYKTKTTHMIDYVKKTNPRDALYRAMQDCLDQALKSFHNNNWPEVGQCMNAYHGFLSALGVSDIHLETLVYRFRELPGVRGVKISGSGGGDCVIALSDHPIQTPSSFLLNISPKGLISQSF